MDLDSSVWIHAVLRPWDIWLHEYKRPAIAATSGLNGQSQKR